MMMEAVRVVDCIFIVVKNLRKNEGEFWTVFRKTACYIEELSEIFGFREHCNTIQKEKYE